MCYWEIQTETHFKPLCPYLTDFISKLDLENPEKKAGEWFKSLWNGMVIDWNSDQPTGKISIEKDLVVYQLQIRKVTSKQKTFYLFSKN